MSKIEILIATCSPTGLSRVSVSSLPTVSGVSYIIGVQASPLHFVPDTLQRSDIKVVESPGIGLVRNRNFLMEQASAPWVVIADDDIDYRHNELLALRDSLENEKDADLCTFRCRFPEAPRTEYGTSFNLKAAPKCYWVSSVEMALRREAVMAAGLKFNECFGVGSGFFESGEEEIFLTDFLRAGLKGRYLPLRVGQHRGGVSTGQREITHNFMMTKGTVIRYKYSKTWPLHLLAAAVHCRKMSMLKYGWEGIRMASKWKVFD